MADTLAADCLLHALLALLATSCLQLFKQPFAIRFARAMLRKPAHKLIQKL